MRLIIILQADREKSVLAFIFLTKESLPDNPTEADFDADEHSNRTQVRMIPHDEVSFPSFVVCSEIKFNMVNTT